MIRIFFKIKSAAVNQNGAKEADTITKNRRSSKSHTSRQNLLRTKSTVILAAMLVMVSFDGYAQKLTTGSLNFLKGQEKLHLVLNFEDVILQGKPEKEYLALEESKEWVEGWEIAKTSIFKEILLEHLNKNLKVLCGDFPDAQYQAEERVLDIRRKMGHANVGKYLEGPGTRRITCEVVFTKTGEYSPLAKISIRQDSQANTSFLTPSAVQTVTRTIGSAGSNSHLTGVEFGYIGQELGRFMNKKIK